MDLDLLTATQSRVPDLNDRVCSGLATEQLRGVERYIDRIFQAAARDFPEGLEYKGYRPTNPIEEFELVTRDRDGKSSYELARSDFYTVAYNFTYNGEELFPRYLYLPFVEKGGRIHVRGKEFAISPVLTDPSFSVGAQSMFIQLTRARLTFERVIHHFHTTDGRETTYVVWSWVHSSARKRYTRKTSSRIIYSSMVHYLFAKYGVTKTFSEFAGADVVVGDDTTITVENYPKDEWIICSTAGVKPRGVISNDVYKATRIRLAIPREQYNDAVKSLVGGFFYIVDHFPRRIKADHVDETWDWKITLGQIIIGSGSSDGMLVTDIDEHIISLDEYVDRIVADDLKRDGIECENIYELFMYVIGELSNKVAAVDNEIGSLYGKRLITLRYVMFDVVSQINMLMYKLRAMKKKRSDLTADDINGLMNKFLRSDRIMGISNHARHPEVSPISTSSDNLYFSITANMITQENASPSGGKKSKINLKDPMKHVHVSVAEVASYNAVPKSDPTGRSRINPCVILSDDHVVQRDPNKKALLDYTQSLIEL